LINAVKCLSWDIKGAAIQIVFQSIWLGSCKKNGKAHRLCDYSRTRKEIKIGCYGNKLDGWNKR